MAVYVDDIVLASNNKNLMKKTKERISTLFEIKDLGTLNNFLGLTITKDGEVLRIGQEKYANEILDNFGMADCRPLSLPLDANSKLEKNPTDKHLAEPVDQEKYQSLIGSLLYLATATRPDLAYSVNMLSQFNNDPRKQHWDAAKRLLRYLKGTVNYNLTFRKTKKELCGFTDADWAGDVDDRKSRTGFAFILAGGAISWESKKQALVSLSSMEAEYIALSEAAREALSLKRLLQELGFPHMGKDPTTIFCDNQSAQQLAKNPVFHKRSKHIDIKYHHVRELVDQKIIHLEYVPTNDMKADLLTKAVEKQKLIRFSQGLGLEAQGTSAVKRGRC